MDERPVLVLGATGVFGRRLVGLLARRGVPVVGVARHRGRLEALAGETGIAIEHAELPQGLEEIMRRHRPCCIVDAAGPFQERGYEAPRTAIRNRVPYLDLSDGREDVAAIGTLDRMAREAGVPVIAGASSVPGLSSAVVDRLAGRFLRLDRIVVTICPGNDVPRGKAVVASVLSYAGRDIPVWHDGRWTSVVGWQDMRRHEAGRFGRRRVGACDVPDLALFPERYDGVRTVSVHAGLELAPLQIGLWCLAWLARRGVVRDLPREAGLFTHLAHLTRHFGTDTGAMTVEADGIGRDGRPLAATWILEAWRGDGPTVPVLPAAALALAIRRGDAPAPGARPCLGEASLDEIEALFGDLAVATRIEERHPVPLFRKALGDAFDRVPVAVRAMHQLLSTSTVTGRAIVEHGDNAVARLAARLGLLPAEGSGVPVEVTFGIGHGRETWRRGFGGWRRWSVLDRPYPGGVHERFGPLTVRLALDAHEAGLDYRVEDCRVLGLPLPRVLRLAAEGTERVDELGRFGFDVAIDLPFGLRLVRYHGWLALPGA